MNKLKSEYRDGITLWSAGETFTAPGGEVVEVFYENDDGSGKKTFFVELSGITACAHGDTLIDAIDDAREKRGEIEPLTDDERLEYRAENYRFSVALFRRITRACRSGTKQWLEQRGLKRDVTMTLAEFRDVGGGIWADELEKRLQ